MIMKKLPQYAPVLIYGFLAMLFCLTHYKEGFLFLRGDTGYPLAPEIYLKNHMYSWFNTYWTGVAAGHALNFGFPLLVIIYLLNLVFDPSQSQMILLTGLFFASGYFSYIFFSLASPANIKSNIFSASENGPGPIGPTTLIIPLSELKNEIPQLDYTAQQ